MPPKKSKSQSSKKTEPVTPVAPVAPVETEKSGDEPNAKERNGYKLGMQPPKHVVLYWDRLNDSFWYRLNGQFTEMGKATLAMQMRGLGLSDWFMFDGQREQDWPLWRATQERAVDYAGAMAGHRVGIFTDGGNRTFLVTTEPHGIFNDQNLLTIIKTHEAKSTKNNS